MEPFLDLIRGETLRDVYLPSFLEFFDGDGMPVEMGKI
jgi:hypothetical protein